MEQDKIIRETLNGLGYKGNQSTVIISVFRALGLEKYLEIYLSRGYGLRHLQFLKLDDCIDLGMPHHDAIALNDFSACLRVRVKTYLKNKNRITNSYH